MRTARLALLAALALAGCASSGTGTATTSPPASPAPVTGTVMPTATPPGTLAEIHDPGHVTGTLAGRHCAARDGGLGGGLLPDPSCTPGAIDPAVDQADIGTTICRRGWTATVRPPAAETDAFKYGQAYPAYNVPHSTRTELDHLVPLELGGANDALNLWPETPPTPNPKDQVEGVLNKAVCAHRVTLAAAQRAIAADWATAEQALHLGGPAPPLSPRSAVPGPQSSRPVTDPASPLPVHRACYPLTSGGSCYEPGEFCRAADHGAGGVAGNGERVTCAQSGSRWRWEPA